LAGERSLVAHLPRGALSLPKRRHRETRDLSAKLGYDFTDGKLLTLALTHASARTDAQVHEDNERLEFLGDRVLGLAVAELLSNEFPNAREGELARWYNNLVRAETCAEVAEQWDVPKYIRMGKGNARSASRILGDACEAILGAVFLDGGYEAARQVVHGFWKPHLRERDLGGPSAKSTLQEWAQRRGLGLPSYVEVAREGPDHAPRFTTEVQIEGISPERGQGMNKRAAEEAAALAMLLREGVWQAPHDG
jgi:ribonuclease III